MSPMPPPKPTSEGRRDRHVSFETGQIIRALRTQGPTTPEGLATLVGAAYWEAGRFERALAFAVADGRVVRTGEGTLQAL